MKISFRFSESPGSGTFWTTLDDWNDMDFIHFLSSHMLDPTIGGKRLYKSVVEQALHAEKVGYHGVAIPEHHLVNILLIPSPLQVAVKIAAHTSRIKLMTAVCQLYAHLCRRGHPGSGTVRRNDSGPGLGDDALKRVVLAKFQDWICTSCVRSILLELA